MTAPFNLRTLASLAAALLVACGGSPDPDEDPDPDPDAAPAELVTDPFAGLPTGQAQWQALCAKGYADTVTEAFCAGSQPPSITSFADLRALLGLDGTDTSQGSDLRITGVFHSTAVSGRTVTPLNPRVFFLPRTLGNINPNNPQPDPRYNVIAFSRGDTFAELASKDLVTGEPRFFLFKFEPVCEATTRGCNHADLLTPSIESGWNSYTLYDDETIDNTVFACIRCHEDKNTGRKMLRMQELRNPWSHWFYPEVSKNIAAIDAFQDAHEGTQYAGMDPIQFRQSRPSNLQRLIQNNGALNQPNEFDSDEIETEFEQTGTSPTWDALFAEVVAGREIPIPYFKNPAFQGSWDYTDEFNPILDPQSRLGQMVDAYKDTISGALPRDQMPDVRDVFLPEAVDALYRAAPNLDGRGILIQMCSQCHNNRVNPALTRARFNVADLDTMPQATRDLAIQRLMMPEADIRKMPPNRFYSLGDAERQLVIDELSN